MSDSVPSPVSTSSASRPISVEFIALDAIVPHESPGIRREIDLENRIQVEGIAAHPIIVCSLDDGRFVLLDGTHRLEVLRRLGCSFAPAQVVDVMDEASVVVRTWDHHAPFATDDFAAHNDLERILDALLCEGIECELLAPEAQDGEPGRRCVAVLDSFVGGVRRRFGVPKAAGEHKASLLHRVTAQYGEPDRSVRTDAEWQMAASSGGARPALLVHFEPITPAEIIQFVRDGCSIPSGIDRVCVTSGRVLGLNIPLAWLGSETPGRDSWLRKRLASPARLIPGPVTVFEPDPREYDESVILYDPALRFKSHANF